MSEFHQIENTVYKGAPMKEAKRAMIFVHGRGDSSDKMQLLAEEIVDDPEMALIFPMATKGTWYPKGFMADWEENQPWLDSALAYIDQLVQEIKQAGIKEEDIYFLGFSQGACLTIEYATRNAQQYGGIMVLSGGLIGPTLVKAHYKGDFKHTPILIGCSDIDHHIPLNRLEESKVVLEQMNAILDYQIYPGMDHLINDDEKERVKVIIAADEF